MTDKKQRLQNACDLCKKRKVRCDSAKQPGNICSNCLKDNHECTHTIEKRKRGPRTGTSSRARSAAIQVIVNAVLMEPDTYFVPDNPNVVRKLLVDFAFHIRSLEKQVSRWRQTAAQLQSSKAAQPTSSPNPVSLTSDHSSSDGSDSETDEYEDVKLHISESDITTSLNNLSLESSTMQHFGRGSNIMIAQMAVKIKKEMFGEEVQQPYSVEQRRNQRPEYWKILPWELELQRSQLPLVFPEEDLLYNLVDLYFVHVHPYIPLLHRPSFEKSVLEGLHIQNHRFGCVLLGVCAVASRFSQDSRVLIEGTEDNFFFSAGWKWFKQAYFLPMSSLKQKTLLDLQVCCLLAMYLVGTAQADSMWVIVGIGLRLAQEMGLHRRTKRRPDGPSLLHSEFCTRAFWVLVNFDVIWSISLGRPRGTTSEDYDLELPVERDDEYWENENPSILPSKLSFFVHYCKLQEIAGFAQQVLYPVTNKSKVWKKSISDWQLELDSALNEWFSSIPEHLKWDSGREDSLFFRQSAVLYLAYYWTQMQIHGQFLRPSRNSSPLLFSGPALAICANAARCSARIFEILHQKHFQLPVLFMASTFSTAIVLLVCSWTKRTSARTSGLSKDMQGVYNCLDVISMFEQRYQMAPRMHDIIRSIITMGDQHFQDDSNSNKNYPNPDDSLRALNIPTDGHQVENLTGSARTSSHNFNAATMEEAAPAFFYTSTNPTTVMNPGMGLYSDSNDWITDLVPPGLASEMGANWTFFMAQVDEILQSVDSGQVSEKHTDTMSY